MCQKFCLQVFMGKFLVIGSNFEEGRFDKSGDRRWRDGICLLPDLSYQHFNLDLLPICLLFTFHPPTRGLGDASTCIPTALQLVFKVL